MREEHRRLHHCPPEQLLSAVRSRYWPLSGRREARKVVKNCLSCFRLHPTTPGIKMGDLPKQRVIAGINDLLRTPVWTMPALCRCVKVGAKEEYIYRRDI